MTDPIYAVGDIHGQLEKLEAVLDLITRDGGAQARVVFLGDYVDRGPDSRGVLERLIAGHREGRPWVTLKGNHDRMFALFLQDIPQVDPHLMVGLSWLHPRLGGDTTLASYGIPVSESMRLKEVHDAARAAVPEAHRRFLENLPLRHHTDGIFFAHAGIRPGVPLDQQSEEDLLWIRQDFHRSQAHHPALVVHGHTPVPRATHYGNRVNLDTGAGFGKTLSVGVFENAECWLLTDKGRVSLEPTQ